MDFVDNATGTTRGSGPHPETDLGRQQTQEGMQHMGFRRHGGGVREDHAGTQMRPTEDVGGTGTGMQAPEVRPSEAGATSTMLMATGTAVRPPHA